MTVNRAHAPAGSSKGIREHAAAMKSHGLRLRGKQTVAARPAMAAMARVPPFVEGARMPSLAARPDAKAAKAAAPTGASTPCAGGGPRVEGGCRGPDVAEVRFIVIFYFYLYLYLHLCLLLYLHLFEVQEEVQEEEPDDVMVMRKTCWAELGAHFHDCWRWRRRVIKELLNIVFYIIRMVVEVIVAVIVVLLLQL